MALPSITIISPLSGAFLAPGETTLILEVLDATPDPARTLSVAVNGTTVLNWPSFLLGDWTLEVTTPSLNVTRFKLGRITSWTDPQALTVTANYRALGTGPGVDATPVTALAATFAIEAIDPPDAQGGTRRDTNLALAIRTTATIHELLAIVNGTFAVHSLAGPPRVTTWNRPHFDGALMVIPGRLALSVNPRRRFTFDEGVTFRLQVRLTSDGSTFFSHEGLWSFHTRTRLTTLLDPTLWTSRLDAPFQDAPASEALRVVLLGALRTRIVAPPSEVLLYACIARSALGAVRAQFEREDLDAELPGIVPEDIQSVDAVDRALGQVDILWDPALSEAVSLGVDATLVALIAKTYLHPYPSDRVGAAACLIFAISQVVGPYVPDPFTP